MRVAIFTETYAPYINGVVTHVKLLKEGLEAFGHTVLIVTADTNTKRHYISNGVLHCPAATSKRLYGYGLASPYSHRRLQMIKEFRPDIIHIHQEFGIGFSGSSAAKTLHVPLVYTLHTMYDEYLFYIAPKPLLPTMKKVGHRYVRFLANRAATLTGPSKKVQEFFKDCGVEKGVKIIPNSVELDQFGPDRVTKEQKAELRAKMGIPQEARIACFVGRLGKEKSVDVLIDYWVKTLLDDPRLYLMIIGEGPDHEELKQQVTDAGADGRIIFTGSIPHPQVPPYYAICDMFVTASLTEMNSISMLEAMASGLPVLQRFDELNANQITEGVNGYFYVTAPELAAIVKRIADNDEEQMLVLKASVRESVKSSGAQDLANYMLAVYQSAEAVPTVMQKLRVKRPTTKQN